MKKLYTSLLAAGTAMVFALAPLTSDAQCTTWVAPTDSSGWVDFNTTFGGAPCDDGSGCPVNEITAFEIYADEAYGMDDVLAGGEYIFSACNGTGGTAWNIEYTIIAPSGAVDAFGLDAGSICALTWTASENGTYLIVVSEVGACGTSSNAATNNGFPSITCTDGTADCNSIGIEEITQDSPIVVYPNPSTGMYTVNIDVDPSAVQIFDMNGRMVENINAQNANGVLTFDLSGKDNGTYVVNVVTNGVQISERITLID